MSSKKRKQRMRPIRPTVQSEGHARSRGGKVWVGIALALGVSIILYAMTRPKSPSGSASPPPPSAPPRANAKPQATPTTPPEPVSGPRLDAGSRIFDFGRAEGGQPVDCVFVFTNTGTELLEVTRVSPGCSCMKAGEWTQQVEPGKAGTIAVRLDTTGQYTGPFGKSVFVTCNDATQPNVTLQVKGFVWRPLEVYPPSAVITLSQENPSNSASLRVSSHLDEAVTLSDLQVTLPNVAVELQTNQPGKEYQINLRTIPPLPTANQQGRLSFKTSAPNVPSTNVLVNVNYVPVLQAVPFQLRLPPPPYTNTVTAQAWVRNNGTNPFTILEAAVNLPGVDVKTQDDPMNRGQRLTLEFPAGFQVPPGTNAELTVKTSHPQYPSLRVPILQPARPGP